MGSNVALDVTEDCFTAAVFGASGALGREVLIALEGEGLSIARLVAVGGARSAGQDVRWHGHAVPLISASGVEASGIDVAILAVPPDVATTLRGPLVAEGVLVIDLSGAPPEAGDKALPVLWPTLNADALGGHPGGFALPCGPASTLAPLLSALADVGPIAAVEATVLLSAAAAGRTGEEALSRETFALLGHRLPDPGPFGGVLAFNVLAGSPRGGEAGDPLVDETRWAVAELVPALANARIRLGVVQVPVFTGLGISLSVHYAQDAPEREVVEHAIDARVELVRRPERLALRDSLDLDPILVGDLRRDRDVVRCFAAADVLHRTAAATAELLARVVANDLW